MMRIAIIIAAFVAPFFFPWPYAVFLGLLAGLYVPPLALILGILFDLLYFNSGSSHFLWGTILGALGFLICYFVRRFIKTRIMGA